MLDLFNNISAHKEDLTAIVGAIVIVASSLANIFPKATAFGKVAHFLALNFKIK